MTESTQPEVGMKRARLAFGKYSAPPAPGLQRAGARMPLLEYVRRLWARRSFIAAYSSASNAAGYERSFLGQAWQLLTPLLNILVYFVIFGLLLQTNRGIENFIGFLAIGVFLFTFLRTSLESGSKSITRNLGLIRALQFPRAVLPISTTLMALLHLLYSVVIIVPVMLFTGESLSLRWLEFIPAVALQAMFCLGLALIFARIGARVPDTARILPFATRVWMYGSGVMYSVQVFTRHQPAWVGTILTYNPGYVYLQLGRHALMAETAATATTWFLAIGWAVGTLVIGFLYFWRGEEGYGNA